jgi:diguanylate cyclase (GGDEF)-like protein
MARFDSHVARELVTRAKKLPDASILQPEFEKVLEDAELSGHDRGQLLVALAVASQASAPSQTLAGWLDEAIQLLRSADTGTDTVERVALGMSAGLHASMGDVRLCLDRCLDLLALVGESEEPIGGRVALNFGVALLALGAYPLASDYLEVAVRDCLDEEALNRTRLLIVSCLNLAFTIVGADTVGVLPASSELQQRRIALIRGVMSEVLMLEGEPEMQVFGHATLCFVAQAEGDLDAAAEAWGDLDAISGAWDGLFSRYLAMAETPIALARGDLDRAEALIDRMLGDEDGLRSMVPYRRLVGLRWRAELNERRGNFTAALADLREAITFAAYQSNQLPDALIRQIADRAELERARRGLLDNSSRLAELVRVDELSGVGNRRGFDLCLDSLRESSGNCAMIMLDVDSFKAINDENGHTTGDRVITVAGRILAQALRPIDQIFRYGGDEFVIVLNAESLAVAHVIARRVQAGFAVEDWRAHGIPDGVTVSIGIATGRSVNADEVFAAADVQLYSAKRAGRNTIRPVPA